MSEDNSERRLLEVMLLSRNRQHAICLARRKMTVEAAVRAASAIARGRTFIQSADAKEQAWQTG